MKLLTKANEALLLKNPLYSTDGKPDAERDILVKFFTPDSSFTWYVLEADKHGDDWEFFGWVDGGQFQEYGYFTLAQLQSVRGAYGLPVERDRNFSAKLSEVKK